MDDIELVGIADDDSRQKWRAELDATDEQIREAVAAVGPMPKAVRYFLKSGREVKTRGPSVKGRHTRARQASDDGGGARLPVASAVELPRTQRQIEIDHLILELRRGALDDIEFARRVATLCATLADRQMVRETDTPGTLIRTLFLLR